MVNNYTDIEDTVNKIEDALEQLIRVKQNLEL